MQPQFKIFAPFLALFILSGVILAPFQAKASFFSFGFSTPALAADTTLDPANSGQNSQTLALLEPTVSPEVVVSDKNNPDAVQTDAQVNVAGNALVPSTSAMGTASSEADVSPTDTSVYVVRKGDTYAGIAKMFGISTDTILSANDLKKGDVPSVGDTLIILPFSGVEYTVKKGDTLPGIAKAYKVDTIDIASANAIAENTKLSVGDTLIIPDAQMLDEGGVLLPTTAQRTVYASTSMTKDLAYYAKHPEIPNLAGYFINPVAGAIKTQGLHGPGHRGVDLATHRGTPILAAASGYVLLAHNGWSGGYGNMVMLQHPNGTTTLYGHASKLLVTTGEEVTQGQVIALSGSTGKSTGPHLHFEVKGARNPGADGSWKPWSN